MANITLTGNGLLTSTSIPNIFIDKYMTNANGEFVKIYLYLLRCMNLNRQGCTISELADIFEHTEKDIMRALAYWEKMQLLNLHYNESHEVSSISLTIPADAPAKEASGTEPYAPSSHTQDKKAIEYTREQLDAFRKEEAVQEVLFITENYLGRTLNATDIQTILYWYDGLCFSTDLIEYLIETCISNGHKSLRYMEKIAFSWADLGIHSVAEAKKEHSLHHKDTYAVMKAFGISGRNLIASELSVIRKWTGSYALSIDLIKEACRRTISATGKPSFEYADTILTNWYKNGVHTVNDIARLDAAHQKSRSPSKSRESTGRPASNRFNNFPQRTYNYDQLEKQLLNTTH